MPQEKVIQTESTIFCPEIVMGAKQEQELYRYLEFEQSSNIDYKHLKWALMSNLKNNSKHKINSINIVVIASLTY